MARRYKQAEIDELMLNIPPLPKSFDKWMESAPFKDMNYMFYKRKNKDKTGLCSKCGKLMTLANNKKHNDSGRCPSCKAKVTYKAINMAKYYSDHEVVTIGQKMKDDYIIRYFKVIRKFKNADDTSKFPEETLDTLINPTITHYEASRVHITLSKSKFSEQSITEFRNFETEYSWKLNEMHWVNERKRSGMNNRELLRAFRPFIYKKNLKSLFKNTKWKYSGLDHYKGNHISIDDYLYCYERNPATELILKVGLNKLLLDVIYKTVNWGSFYGTGLDLRAKRLGLDTETFNRAIKMDLSTTEIENLVYYKESGIKLTDKEFRKIQKFDISTFRAALKNSSITKSLNYIKKHASKCNKSETLILGTWKDYMDQCEYLKLDLKESIVLYPRDLFKKHDEYTKLIQDMKDEKVIKRFNTKYNYWHKYLNFNKGKLSIKVAESIGALKEEGIAHDHCVGGYGPIVANSNIIVMLIRKNDNKPFYTLELNLKTFEVIQCQGKNRIEPTKQVESFIKEWQGYINRKRIDRSLKSA